MNRPNNNPNPQQLKQHMQQQQLQQQQQQKMQSGTTQHMQTQHMPSTTMVHQPRPSQFQINTNPNKPSFFASRFFWTAMLIALIFLLIGIFLLFSQSNAAKVSSNVNKDNTNKPVEIKTMPVGALTINVDSVDNPVNNLNDNSSDNLSDSTDIVNNTSDSPRSVKDDIISNKDMNTKSNENLSSNNRDNIKGNTKSTDNIRDSKSADNNVRNNKPIIKDETMTSDARRQEPAPRSYNIGNSSNKERINKSNMTNTYDKVNKGNKGNTTPRRHVPASKPTYKIRS